MMGIGRIARWLRRNGDAQAGALRFLLAPAEMRTLLERERMRSDRSGAVFSLLLLDHSAAAAPIAQVLRRRLRATDVAGHMRRGQIGVFLPDTPSGGAWKVADDIVAMLPADAPMPKCQVYVYPPTAPWQHAPEGEEDSLAAPAAGGNQRPLDAHARTVRARHNGSGSDHPQRRHAGNAHFAPFHAAPLREFERGLDVGLEGELEGGNAATATLERPKPGPATMLPARPLIALLARPLPWWKRAMDILGAATGLILLSPVLLAAAAAVKCSSPGPVLFIQPREGLAGRRFRMFKFRTMVDGAAAMQQSLMDRNEQDGPAFKIARDPRITRVGKKLRDWNIDELPQLWNVLRGEMSLVGPRPLPVEESLACEPWQRRRLDVTPGMTCLWQVRDRRNTIPFVEWMRLDLNYAKRRTLQRDIRLLWDTFFAMFVRRFFKRK